MARKRPTPPARPATPEPAPGFRLGPRIERTAWTQPYVALEQQQNTLAETGVSSGPPIPFRRLRVYTQDPSTPRGRAPVAEVEVPYEPLRRGPVGAFIVVDDTNDTTGETYAPVDLDQLSVALNAGLKPSTATPGFAQQMTYALTVVTYERFRRALGRWPQFSFPARKGDENERGPTVKLHVRPHALEEDNAYYDPESGELCFGYTRAGKHALGLDQPGALVFTALSHDVVVHEMTHALLDGMRTHFMLPTSPDVDGFHEGFSDLVALFQRFTYRDIVKAGLRETRGALTSRLLVDLARQFGAATGDGKTPLRTALAALGDLDEPVPAERRYAPDLEAHDMGAVLLCAVFDAFRAVFANKSDRLRGLAPGDGPLPDALVDLLARDASRLAEQFCSMCIRAVDYCPPVDLGFGEYLRALVTADFDLVPDDPWGYREALVRAFRRYGITVEGVTDLSEESLLWRGPERPDLNLPFHPTAPPPGATPQDLQRHYAEALGRHVVHPDRIHYFGLTQPSTGKGIELPVVESARSLRRIGPDGTVNDDIVGEVVQRRTVRGRVMHGGSTVIFTSDGTIRYVIGKSVTSKRREARIFPFLADRPGRAAMFDPDAPPAAVRLRQLHRRRRQDA